MICKECAGEYADWVQKCPYCGSINEEADEKLYMEHMEQMRERLDVVDEESEEKYKRIIEGPTKKALIAAGVVIVLVVIGGIALAIWNQWNQDEYEVKYSQRVEWQREEFPILDELFEQGDYDACLEEINKYSDKDSFIYSFSNWKHTTFLQLYYVFYQNVKLVQQDVDNGKSISAGMLTLVINDSLFLRRDVKMLEENEYIKSSLTEEDLHKVVEYNKEIAEIFPKITGMSIESADEYVEKYYKDNSVGYIEASTSLANKIIEKKKAK